MFFSHSFAFFCSYCFGRVFFISRYGIGLNVSVTKKQKSHPVNSKHNIQFCTVSSQIDFIQYKFDHQKKYFISENRPKDALNHGELCEIAIQM